MRKVWYYQIWIQNNLGFMVSDLLYIPFSSVWCLPFHFLNWAFSLILDPYSHQDWGTCPHQNWSHFPRLRVTCQVYQSMHLKSKSILSIQIFLENRIRERKNSIHWQQGNFIRSIDNKTVRRYCKFASSRLSRLVAHTRIFRRENFMLMYCDLWPKSLKIE